MKDCIKPLVKIWCLQKSKQTNKNHMYYSHEKSRPSPRLKARGEYEWKASVGPELCSTYLLALLERRVKRCGTNNNWYCDRIFRLALHIQGVSIHSAKSFGFEIRKDRLLIILYFPKTKLCCGFKKWFKRKKSLTQAICTSKSFILKRFLKGFLKMF